MQFRRTCLIRTGAVTMILYVKGQDVHAEVIGPESSDYSDLPIGSALAALQHRTSENGVVFVFDDEGLWQNDFGSIQTFFTEQGYGYVHEEDFLLPRSKN